MQTKTSETCGGLDHEKKTMLADKAVANKTTANSRNSTRTWRRVHGDWFPGCSSSTESRAREALSGLLTGSGYCGPWGSTIQRSTLTFFSMSSIMRSMRQISCSMMPCSWISRPAAGTWLSAWFRSGRLSARAATSLPPPVIPKKKFVFIFTVMKCMKWNCAGIYLGSHFAPVYFHHPVRRWRSFWKLCTCRHGRAPGWRRTPPRGAPSPYVAPQGGSCLADVKSGAGRWRRTTFGPSLLFVAVRPAAAGCPYSHQRMTPSVYNTPPPVWVTTVFLGRSK